MRKSSWFIIIIMALAGAYLYWAHFLIYYHMGAAGLKAPDVKEAYVVGNGYPQARKMVYAALGDSLTSGVGVDNYQYSYPYVLAEKLSTKLGQEVILQPFAYPGYRTADFRNNLLPQVIAAQPDIITLLIGVNDMHGQLGEEHFQKEYQQILEELTKKTKARIYLISLPYLGANTLLLPPYQAYFKYQTIKYNQIIVQLAAKYQLKFIDIYTPTVKLFERNGPYYAADSFHPSAPGYQLWSQIIYDAINY